MLSIQPRYPGLQHVGYKGKKRKGTESREMRSKAGAILKKIREEKDLNYPSEMTEMSEKREEQGHKVTGINSAFSLRIHLKYIASEQQRLT